MIEKYRDRSSLDSFKESGDVYIREYKIAAMQKRIVRDKLRECFLVEGVNHKEKCKDLIDQYTLLVLDRFHGMKFPEGMEPPSRVKTALIIPADFHLKVPHWSIIDKCCST